MEPLCNARHNRKIGNFFMLEKFIGVLYISIKKITLPGALCQVQVLTLVLEQGPSKNKSWEKVGIENWDLSFFLMGGKAWK